MQSVPVQSSRSIKSEWVVIRSLTEMDNTDVLKCIWAKGEAAGAGEKPLPWDTDHIGNSKRK